MHGPTLVHAVETGPAVEAFLQWPRTASSGRKLITESLGD
jgi:hypothetical protein